MRVSPSPRILPLGLLVLGIAIPLVGSGFATAGLAVVWALVSCGVVAALVALKPAPEVRVFAELATLVVLFLLASLGGWWLIPAVAADMAITARSTSRK
jgi:uncharacterized membrane protein YqjE